jgi:hypothetical protein
MGMAAPAHHLDGYSGRSSAIELCPYPQRLEHAFKWDACLAARRAHVCFSSMEEQEHGLLDRHQDGPDEPNVVSLPPKFPNTLPHPANRAPKC